MKALEFSGLVTSGKLPPQVAQAIASAIRRLEGKRLVVSLREQKRRRSTRQNAYYWGCCLPVIVEMFREAGNMVDAEDVHSYLKSEVGKLAQVLVTPDGEVLKAPGSTTKLSTQEFEVYLEKVRAWAASFGLSIPLPHEEIL